jgi:hypothetical protein
LGARFSAEIFGYNPYYYGKNSAPIAHPSQITISDSIYLNSPLHWILDNSQIGGALTRETDLRDSDRQSLLLQALLGCLMTKGEKIQIKDLDLVSLSVLHLHRSDRCLLVDESSLVISLELHLSGLENICVSATECLNLVVIIKRLYC